MTSLQDQIDLPEDFFHFLPNQNLQLNGKNSIIDHACQLYCNEVQYQ